MFIEVFPETRKEDVEDVWQAVEDLLSAVSPDRPQRRRRRTKLERDLHAQAAAASGSSFEEIVGQKDSDTLEDTERKERLMEALQTSTKRLKRAQRKTGKGTDPSLAPDQLDWLQTFTWTDEQEWQRQTTGHVSTRLGGPSQECYASPVGNR